MDAVKIIKEQEILGVKIADCYNALSNLARSDLSLDELRAKLLDERADFKRFVSEFNKNDNELRPPSSTLERNSYFKSSFVDEVHQAVKNFDSLYSQLKEKLMREDQANFFSTETGLKAQEAGASGYTEAFSKMQENLVKNTQERNNKPIRNTLTFDNSIVSKNQGLVRQLQYVLDDLESKISKFRLKEVSVEIVKEKYRAAEKVFLRYMGEFQDDDLTQIFYSLRDLYSEIPGIENHSKSLTHTLPSIDIPTFSGKFVEWETFSELFQQLVIDQPIPNTQKMCVLKSKLKGEAASKISKLPSIDENFEVAWKILKNYYSNKRASTSVYFKSIVDAPFVFYNTKSLKFFLNTVNESLQALGSLKIEAQEMYQAFLCFVLQRKLEAKLRVQFEQHLGKSRDLPSVENLIEFLNQMEYSLEASQDFSGQNLVNPSGNNKSWEAGQKTVNPSRYGAQHAQGGGLKFTKIGDNWTNPSKMQNFKCSLGCSIGHSLYKCAKFKNLSTKERWDKVKELGVCSKCLSFGHSWRQCTSNWSCRSPNCNSEHNTLLHSEKEREKQSQKSAVVNKSVDKENTCILLSTAIVEVQNGEGKWVDCRVLMDSGSQVCLITKSFKNSLKIKGERIEKAIEGLSKTKSLIDEKVGVKFRSKNSSYKTFVDALVIKTILSNVPETKVVPGEFSNFVKLADPSYNIPKGIDMLIGAEIFFDTISDGKEKDKNKNLFAKNSKLGWLISGPATINDSKPESNMVATVHAACDELLQKFWETEEVPQINKLTTQEKVCENMFEKEVKIIENGKFQVKLPFKENPKVLGNSGFMAKRRFFALERKLEKNQDLKIQYNDFIKQYLELGHMEIMTNKSLIDSGYYLPHHCVLKPESTTTKLRVVFDASCKTTTNISLNDILHTGPRIQEDLFNILLRFRKHRYVFSADIEKMYRQIWVEENDKKYQLIFWRWNPNECIKTYALKTVTYGTASAPYLAVKCLQKISDWKSNQFPDESEAIRCDFYMDDLMTGGDCFQTVKKLRENINSILLEFGMPLRKWCSNEKNILEGVEEKHIEVNFNIDSGLSNTIKTLGIMWDPNLDEFGLKCSWDTPAKVSKRTILGEISRLFDPLGLVGPVVVTTKILLQDLWKLKIDWDEKIPEDINLRWNLIRENFLSLNMVKVPRHIICVNPTQVEFHGFCDSSMKAYGAVVYVRSRDNSGNFFSNLAASKSRVAPIKILTLPRLELCASVLLIELMKMVVGSLKLNSVPTNIFYYTDSSIVLSWLRLDPARLQIFVSNRVSFVQCNSEIHQWRHVKSEENPADLLSRGLLGKNIIGNTFWFEGPSFLKEEIISEAPLCKVSILPEIKKSFKTLLVQEKEFLWGRINHRNKFSVLQNVLAYILKFVNITRKRSSKPFIAYRKEALCQIVKDIQEINFPEELKILKMNVNVPKRNRLRTLCPILDTNGIIRVGGRLENSYLSYDAKHPILLPYKNKIVELLIEGLHSQHLHVGPQGLLAIVRQQFWPLRGRQLTKKVVNKCYRCFRVEPRNLHQFMGNLPEDRVIRSRPFLNVGVDFLGPILIHYKIRGKKTDKSYVCVFVCFTTKAAHLEVVSDLSSAAFIGALKRFVARRGCPLKIYSDNGTNFIGAANSLNEIYKLFASKPHNLNLNEFCTQRQIEWVNIPARSPHIGGLWEACVKSVKKHFYRVTEGTMTYEELCTLMAQIESVLNSRPLIPLSDDPNDFKVLTPGHFLIGESYSVVVDSTNNKCYQGMRDHWKAAQSNIEEFWKRWSGEYLSELHKRYKWNKPCDNIQPGTLVLLKEDNIPPMSWRRGRVIRTIMGSDGFCRMVDVRTSNGETKRSIHNVCPFPTEQMENEGMDNPTEKENTNCNVIKENYVNKNCNTLKENHFSKNVHKNKVNSDIVKENGFQNKNSKNCNRIKNKNMLTILLSLLAILSPVKSHVNISSFVNNAGIFFEEVSAVGLTKTSWNIVVHINISEYAAAKSGFDKGMLMIRNIEATQPGTSETYIMQGLQASYGRIEDNHQLIMSSAPDRSKRSLLPFVGSIYHSLFGLMDEEHAEMLERRIQANEENQDQLLSILRNQSSLQDVTLDVIKEQNKVVFKNMEKISESLLVLEKSVNKMKDEERLRVAVTNMASELETFAEVQQDLISAMFGSKGGVLHGILSVTKFKKQIDHIKTTINERLRLPTENPLELIKLARVTTRTTENFVLFNIRIPLRNVELMTAYAIHTYPILKDGLSIKIRPSSNYVMIDERKIVYYHMNEENFEHCQKSNKIMLCPQQHPLHITRETNNCEILLLLRSTKIPDSCEIEIKEFSNFWKQTHSPNTWIFSVKQGTVADIKCKGKTEVIALHNQGLLTLQPDCEMETSELHLYSYDEYNTDINYILPHVNISMSLPPLTHIKLKTDIETYKLPNIPNATKIFGFSTHLDFHHIAHYGTSLSTCIIIILVIIAIIWILRKTCRMSTQYLPAAVALPRLM